MEIIYGTDDPIPTTFTDYRDKVLKIGRMKERFRQQFQVRTVATPPATAPTPRAPHTFVTNIHPVPQKKTATGITYGGAGEPMAVDKLRKDNRCFNCGETGHFRRDCPKEQRKINVRALLYDMTEEEIKEFLEKAVETEEDQDFLEGQ